MGSSLTIEKVHAAYGAVRVIEDVSMTVNAGETVTLLGTNGNGKSTLMKCVMGMLRPTAGRIVAEIDGEKHDLIGLKTKQIVDLGIALVPEGRRLVPETDRAGKSSARRFPAQGARKKSNPISSSATSLFRAWPNGAISSPAT